MKQPIKPYYSTPRIDELIHKVISTRSLSYEQFTKQLELLMDEVHHNGWQEGRTDLLESMSYYD